MRLPFQSLFENRTFSLRDPALAKLLWGGGSSTAAGIAVSEDSALNIAAYWRGVQLISGQIAAMPLHLYKGDKTGAKERFASSKLYKLLHDKPNSEMTAFTFRESMQAHLLTWGNAYAEIEWNGQNQPIGLQILTPDRVTVFRDVGDFQVKYRIAPSNRVLTGEDVLHIPGLSFDGLIGYSVIARARQSLGLTAAAERYGATFFGNGAHMGGVMTVENDLDPEQEKELRERINREHRGPDRAHGILLLSNVEGMKYERMSIPPNDAQFLETRKMGVTEIARWLGILPHKLYDLERATFSNIEQQGIDYYVDTMWMWTEKWEQALNDKLIPSLESNYQFFEFDFNGIMRADTAARFAAYRTAVQNGWMNINEVRMRENANPVTGGEIYRAPMNSISLDKFKDWVDNKVNPPKPAPVEQKPPVDPKDLENQLKAQQARAEAAETLAMEKRAEADAARNETETLRQRDVVRLDELADKQRAADVSAAQAEAQTALALTEQKERARLQNLYDAQVEATQRQSEATALEREARSTLEQTASVLTTRADALEAERADLQKRLAIAQSELQAAQVDVRRLTASAKPGRAVSPELERRCRDLQGQLDEAATANRQLQALQTELTDVRAAADQARREVEEAQRSFETRQTQLTTDADTARRAAEAADTARAEADAARVVALTERDTATREAQAYLDQRVGEVLEEHRSLLTGTMRRMIAREIDRMQRAMVSPDKLRAAIEPFYDSFTPKLIEALEESLGPHLAWCGRRAERQTIATRFAEAHVRTSKRDLQAVLEAGGDLAVPMTDLFDRWQRVRVPEIASQVVQAEVNRRLGIATPTVAPGVEREVVRDPKTGLITKVIERPIAGDGPITPEQTPTVLPITPIRSKKKRVKKIIERDAAGRIAGIVEEDVSDD